MSTAALRCPGPPGVQQLWPLALMYLQLYLSHGYLEAQLCEHLAHSCWSALSCRGGPQLLSHSGASPGHSWTPVSLGLFFLPLAAVRAMWRFYLSNVASLSRHLKARSSVPHLGSCQTVAPESLHHRSNLALCSRPLQSSPSAQFWPLSSSCWHIQVCLPSHTWSPPLWALL